MTEFGFQSKVFLAFESSKVKSDTILFNLKELNKLSPIQSPILDNNCAINKGIFKIYFLFNCLAIE